MTVRNFKSITEVCFRKDNPSLLLTDTLTNRSINYAEGDNLVNFAVAKLQALSIRKGDRVVTYTALSLDSVVLAWGCFLSGVVFIPVDHNWPSTLLNQVIEETSPKFILTANDSFLEGYESDKCYPSADTPATAPSDLAAILYTSGSTGRPKGVMLSQQALYNSGRLVATHFNWNADDRFMNLGDLHSMSGLRNTCLAPLHAGASFIIATEQERGNVLLIIDLIEKFTIHYIGVAPTVVRQMNILFSPSRKEKLLSLKAVLCTGGPLAKDQMELFYQHYGKPVLNYYGLTETAGICSGHNLATYTPSDNSIGPALGAELFIKPDQEYSTEEGVGELLVKSNNLMSGYFNREEETAEVLKEGYFYTGDIVRKRADGCYELLGRKRNIIKNIRSELICLEEIENALELVPVIRDACACTYAAYEEDEKIVAFIVLVNGDTHDYATTVKEIKKYLADKLGKNRVPWCYYIEEQLPRSSTGKIQRQTIKDKLHEYIGTNRKRYF